MSYMHRDVVDNSAPSIAKLALSSTECQLKCINTTIRLMIVQSR